MARSQRSESSRGLEPELTVILGLIEETSNPFGERWVASHRGVGRQTSISERLFLPVAELPPSAPLSRAAPPATRERAEMEWPSGSFKSGRSLAL